MDGRANDVALARSWPLLRPSLLPLTDYTCRHHSPALSIQAGGGLRRAEEGLGREGRSRGGRIDRFGISRLNHDPNQDVRPRVWTEKKAGESRSEESRFHCCLPLLFLPPSLYSRHIPKRPQFVQNDSLEDFVACDAT